MPRSGRELRRPQCTAGPELMLTVAHTTPADPVACQRLAALGVTVFEIDVRLRNDRVVATHYLPLLPRLELVQRHNRRVRVTGPWTRDVPLDQVAGNVPPQCRILLDCKDDTGTRAARLSHRIRLSLTDPGRYVVASKNWSALAPLRASGFEVWASAAAQGALTALISGDVECDAVTVRHSLLTHDAVRALGQAYGGVVAWTVNDVSRAQVLTAMGVSGLTSDDPRVLGMSKN